MCVCEESCVQMPDGKSSGRSLGVYSITLKIILFLLNFFLACFQPKYQLKYF